MVSLGHGGGPILARKRLAAALRELRESSGHTLEQVAGDLMISVSKLSRLEKAQGQPQPRDVRDLINLYGVDDTALADKLTRWAKESRLRPWWQDYEDVLTPEQDDYLAYEAEATVNLAFSVPFVHGLLQCDSYVEAMATTFGHHNYSPEDAELLVATRRARRANLDRRPDLPPLELRVVLHQACLSFRPKQSGVREAQLRHLLDVSHQENVELRVLPWDADPHRAATGMWQHFSFGEDIDRDIVCLESPSGFTYIDEERKTRLYQRWFEELSRRSLNLEKTRNHIRQLLAEG